MSRRSFLGMAAVGASLASLARESVKAKYVGEERVVVAHGGAPYQLVKGALSHLGGMENFVDSGDVVLLKPNASFEHPEPWRGACTDPKVLATVVNLCLMAGAERVIVVDHPLGDKSAGIIRRNGLQDATEAFGGEFVVVGETHSDYESNVPVEGGRTLESVDVAKQCTEADVLINLPVLKHHSATGACVGLKNLMGLVRDRDTFHFPGPLQECIADLALLLRPDLTIVDATRVLANNGPGGPGEVLPIGRVVAGTDPVAVDVASLSLVSRLGYDAFEVDPSGHNQYVVKAASLGIGVGDHESVASITDEIDVSTIEDTDLSIEGGSRGLPPWAPYASLSAAAIALGLVGIIHNRRRSRYGQR